MNDKQLFVKRVGKNLCFYYYSYWGSETMYHVILFVGGGEGMNVLPVFDVVETEYCRHINTHMNSYVISKIRDEVKSRL